MSVIVVLKAKLLGDTGEIKKLHDQAQEQIYDQVTAAGEMAHKVYLNPADPKDFLAIEEWESAESFIKFSSDPEIQKSFGTLFDGKPDVAIYEKTDWYQW